MLIYFISIVNITGTTPHTSCLIITFAVTFVWTRITCYVRERNAHTLFRILFYRDREDLKKIPQMFQRTTCILLKMCFSHLFYWFLFPVTMPLCSPWWWFLPTCLLPCLFECCVCKHGSRIIFGLIFSNKRW